MAFKFILTDAGKQELINAEHSGTARVRLTRVGFGVGQYTPNPTQSEMLQKFKDITAVSGENVGDNIIHIAANDQSEDSYSLFEVGVYTDQGTLFAIYSQTKPILIKSSECGALLAIDLAITEGDSSKIEFGDIQFSNPLATTITAGVVKLATNKIASEMIDGSKVITAANLGAIFSSLNEDSFGYTRLPGGNLMQYGKGNFDPEGQKITFPLSFEHQIEYATAFAKSPNLAVYFWINESNNSNIIFQHNGNGYVPGYWFAIGR